MKCFGASLRLPIGCELDPYTHGELWCASLYTLTFATFSHRPKHAVHGAFSAILSLFLIRLCYGSVWLVR